MKSHGGGDPLELASIFDSESCQVAVLFVNGHLPETRGQVDCGEDAASGPSNVSDAFRDFLHGVFVRLGFQVEPPEILDDPQSLTIFLGYAEDG